MLGVDRTYDGHHGSDVNDPKRKYRELSYSITSSAREKNGGIEYTGADIIREGPQAAIHGTGIRRHLAS
jgi:hypothetical protein